MLYPFSVVDEKAYSTKPVIKLQKIWHRLCSVDSQWQIIAAFEVIRNVGGEYVNCSNSSRCGDGRSW